MSKQVVLVYLGNLFVVDGGVSESFQNDLLIQL